jgi:hypothetical protein
MGWLMSESNVHEPILKTKLGFVPSKFFLKLVFQIKGVILDEFYKHTPNPRSIENYHVRV